MLAAQDMLGIRRPFPRHTALEGGRRAFLKVDVPRLRRDVQRLAEPPERLGEPPERPERPGQRVPRDRALDGGLAESFLRQALRDQPERGFAVPQALARGTIVPSMRAVYAYRIAMRDRTDTRGVSVGKVLPRSVRLVSGALWFRGEPWGHEVEFVCLEPAIWPKEEADDSHELVPAESRVVALTYAVEVDHDGQASVGRVQQHCLRAKVNPKDPAFDDQRWLLHGWRLRPWLRRQHEEEQAGDGEARYPPSIDL
jgi:hypothetical protein